jgi:hypothetical protein
MQDSVVGPPVESDPLQIGGQPDYTKILSFANRKQLRHITTNTNGITWFCNVEFLDNTLIKLESPENETTMRYTACTRGTIIHSIEYMKNPDSHMVCFMLKTDRQPIYITFESKNGTYVGFRYKKLHKTFYA